MPDIFFKNYEGLLIMKLSEFSFHESAIKRVYYEIEVNYDFFMAKTRVESEKFDFEDLAIGLEKIYQKEWKSIGFSPIEKQFCIRFDLLENGQLNVHIKLSNLTFTGILDFKYVTDQSFIPELIREIKIAMKEIRIN